MRQLLFQYGLSWNVFQIYRLVRKRVCSFERRLLSSKSWNLRLGSRHLWGVQELYYKCRSGRQLGLGVHCDGFEPHRSSNMEIQRSQQCQHAQTTYSKDFLLYTLQRSLSGLGCSQQSDDWNSTWGELRGRRVPCPVPRRRHDLHGGVCPGTGSTWPK